MFLPTAVASHRLLALSWGHLFPHLLKRMVNSYLILKFGNERNSAALQI